MKNIFYVLLLLCSNLSISQVGIGTENPDPAASLDIFSDTKGVLIPRMTTVQRDAIIDPIEGLEIYATDQNAKFYFDGTAWQRTNKNEFATSYQVYSFPDRNTGTGASSLIQFTGMIQTFKASDANFAQPVNGTTIQILESGTYTIEINGQMRRRANNNAEGQISGRTVLRRNGVDLRTSDAAIGIQIGTSILNGTNLGSSFSVDLEAGDMLTFWFQKSTYNGNITLLNLGFTDNILTIKK